MEQGEEGAAEHADHEFAGCNGGEFAKSGDREGEDGSPHDRVEKAYGYEQPGVLEYDGEGDENGRAGGGDDELCARRNLRQRGAAKASDEHEAPVDCVSE